MGKGEIARFEQFFLFEQCFQKTLTADTCGNWSKVRLLLARKACDVWRRLNSKPAEDYLLTITRTDINSLTLSKRQILDSSELREVADDNFKFDENGRKLSERVENTVGKGEIAP